MTIAGEVTTVSGARVGARQCAAFWSITARYVESSVLGGGRSSPHPIDALQFNHETQQHAKKERRKKTSCRNQAVVRLWSEVELNIFSPSCSCAAMKPFQSFLLFTASAWHKDGVLDLLIKQVFRFCFFVLCLAASQI